MLGNLSRSEIDLKPALEEMFGKVAQKLLGSEKLPEEVSQFCLDPRFKSPEKDTPLTLLGFMCPAHEDNVSHGGESDNRTITLHRLIESAVVERGHVKALCINVNAVLCLKDGDGNYANPCVRDEEVRRFSEFVRAIFFAALDAHGVKVTRIVQSSGGQDPARGPFHLGPWRELFRVRHAC